MSLKLMFAPNASVTAKVISKKFLAPVLGIVIYSVPPNILESQSTQTPPMVLVPLLLFTESCKLEFQVVGASWA